MAKKAARTAEKAKKVITLSARLQTKIDALKATFRSYAGAWKLSEEKRIKVAPIFMSAFGSWTTETGRGSFIEFCRLVDPTIPKDRDGYLKHPGYRAATYLRRLQRADVGENRVKPLRANLGYMSRALATIVAILPDGLINPFWLGMKKEFELNAAQFSALQGAVAKAQPLVKLPVVAVRKLEIVHDTGEAEAQEDREEAAA